ncbi:MULTISPECIES: FidL-like protein [Tenebrionibacter/Tenebrionicola group]|jgi:hypothetical protein|uniref:Uncharacterized protein n=2 Tax=Tenebrionibacter/Tenebrionicola group TaxID=2969848 RepID=A0A8K0XWF7_9ENTR|nr:MULTISPECIES: FidL-like protein [Tenebrionibacter/Tenebrionicola group]MBK4715081.1 hypothetical protein [Tenebrionibacter intestinalis]MBV5096259.1 hypothetical protein [Tenebrionicola larvae]
MLKNIAIAVIAIVISIITYFSWSFYQRYLSAPFFCESEFSIIEKINDNHIRADGLFSLVMTDKHLFINIDGLMTKNDSKFIISRVIRVEYNRHNRESPFHRIENIKTSRYSTDNIDDDLASVLLFSPTGENQLLYIQKVNNNMLFFGSQLFPRYGCKRN